MRTRRNDSKPKKLKTLVIDRRRWLRGDCPDPKGVLSSMLHRPNDGRMCCLGFLALSCGATVSDIDEKELPEQAKVVDWPKGVLVGRGHGRRQSALTQELIHTNDDEKLEEPEREKQVREGMRKLGYAVRFVG